MSCEPVIHTTEDLCLTLWAPSTTRASCLSECTGDYVCNTLESATHSACGIDACYSGSKCTKEEAEGISGEIVNALGKVDDKQDRFDQNVRFPGWVPPSAGLNLKVVFVNEKLWCDRRPAVTRY